MPRNRKKETQVAPADQAANGDAGGETAVASVEQPASVNGNGQHRKPEISWRLNSDRTTSIEVAA